MALHFCGASKAAAEGPRTTLANGSRSRSPDTSSPSNNKVLLSEPQPELLQLILWRRTPASCGVGTSWPMRARRQATSPRSKAQNSPPKVSPLPFQRRGKPEIVRPIRETGSQGSGTAAANEKQSVGPDRSTGSELHGPRRSSRVVLVSQPPVCPPKYPSRISDECRGPDHPSSIHGGGSRLRSFSQRSETTDGHQRRQSAPFSGGPALLCGPWLTGPQDELYCCCLSSCLSPHDFDVTAGADDSWTLPPYRAPASSRLRSRSWVGPQGPN